MSAITSPARTAITAIWDDPQSTPRNNTLKKIVLFSALLGLGLMYFSVWAGISLTALSGCALYYLTQVDTQLIEAAEDRKVYKAKWLLSLGANPNFTTNSVEPALVRAAQSGDLTIVKDLLKAGANPNIHRCVHGIAGQASTCALSEAASRGDLPMMETLLTNNANPNFQDSHGRTPLYEAVSASQDQAVERLLRQGADPTIRTRGYHENRTPREKALLLQQEGAAPLGIDRRTDEQLAAALNRIVQLLRERG